MVHPSIFILTGLTLCFLMDSTYSAYLQLAPPEVNAIDWEPYKIEPVEKRPWSNVNDGMDQIKIERRIPFHFMGLTLREFQRNCDGQCFYHPGYLINPPPSGRCDPVLLECGLMASFARHGDGINHCAYLGAALGNYNETICNPSIPDQQFYTISLIRSVDNASCPFPWDFAAKMPCMPLEYVAISLSYQGGAAAPDRWFTCVGGEQNVTFWEDTPGPPKPNSTIIPLATQLTDTNPYEGQSPGVIASRIIWDKDTSTLSCRFLISAEFMDKDNVTAVKFPRSGGSAVPIAPIEVKLAQGRVNRTFLPFNPEDHKDPDKREEYFTNNMVLEFPFFASQGPTDEFVSTNALVGVQGTENVIDFPSLTVEMVTLQPQVDVDADKHLRKEIEHLATRCDTQGRDTEGTVNNRTLNVTCYHPNKQRSCIYRQRCAVFVMAEEPSSGEAKMVQLRMISFRPLEMNYKQVIRPMGYAAMAFSKDPAMGNDVVFACLFQGVDPKDSRMTVSWNYGHANFYDGNDTNQNLIQSPKIRVARADNHDLVICEWQVEWKFNLSVKHYPPWKTHNENSAEKKRNDPEYETIDEEIEYDLRGEYFILITTGQRVYNGGRMAYHDFRQTINEKYDGSRLAKADTIRINVTVIIVGFLVLYIF